MLPGKAVLKAFGLAPAALLGSPTAERALNPLQIVGLAHACSGLTTVAALCTCMMWLSPAQRSTSFVLLTK